jgi:hypothetical protein
MQPSGLKNCHVNGVHSIVVRKYQEGLLRVFYTTPDHGLWKNQPGEVMSVAIHSHHCDLALVPLFGAVHSLVFKKTTRGMFMNGYRFRSHIGTGSGSFERVAGAGLELVSRGVLCRGQSAVMRAADLHTVYVSKGSRAAWLVCEGREDPAYDSVCYTNADLGSWTPNGLYVPMTDEQVRADLAGLLLYGV